jgi:glycine cleavage system aminomethyltransferase T
LIDGEPFTGTNEARWQLSWRDGEYAGYASASAYSPRAKSNIAVAMVNAEVVDEAAPVIVHTGAANLGARVVALPII